MGFTPINVDSNGQRLPSSVIVNASTFESRLGYTRHQKLNPWTPRKPRAERDHVTIKRAASKDLSNPVTQKPRQSQCAESPPAIDCGFSGLPKTSDGKSNSKLKSFLYRPAASETTCLESHPPGHQLDCNKAKSISTTNPEFSRCPEYMRSSPASRSGEESRPLSTSSTASTRLVLASPLNSTPSQSHRNSIAEHEEREESPSPSCGDPVSDVESQATLTSSGNRRSPRQEVPCRDVNKHGCLRESLAASQAGHSTGGQVNSSPGSGEICGDGHDSRQIMAGEDSGNTPPIYPSESNLETSFTNGTDPEVNATPTYTSYPASGQDKDIGQITGNNLDENMWDGLDEQDLFDLMGVTDGIVASHTQEHLAGPVQLKSRLHFNEPMEYKRHRIATAHKVQYTCSSSYDEVPRIPRNMTVASESKSSISSVLDVSTHGKRLDSGCSTPGPQTSTGTVLEPFVRACFPRVVKDPSPISGLSGSSSTRVCFRIGELFKIVKKAASQNSAILVELYSIILEIKDVSGELHFVLGDLFFPKRPPHVEAIWRGWQSNEYSVTDAKALKDASLCRVFGKVEKRPSGKLIMRILSAQGVYLEDVLHVKGIVCAQ